MTQQKDEALKPNELQKRLAGFLDAPEAKTFTIVKDGDQLLFNTWTEDLRAKQFAALTRPAPSPAPDALREAAEEAVLQLEYLDGKFAPTGTTAAVLAKLRAALTRYEESRK